MIKAITYTERIRFISPQPLLTLKGILKGMDTTIERDKDRSKLPRVKYFPESG